MTMMDSVIQYSSSVPKHFEIRRRSAIVAQRSISGGEPIGTVVNHLEDALDGFDGDDPTFRFL
jgi:hypothetical protein